MSEIFRSIQGESTWAGLPCVFVRLSGCNLACRYCDTRYAKEEAAEEMTAEAVCAKVFEYGSKLIEITGGEPLLQSDCSVLAEALIARGITVLVETNGTLPIDALPPQAIRIMDIKCPGSGESGHVDWANVARLGPRDEVKFVITDRADYEWARGGVVERDLAARCHAVLFSPVLDKLPPRELAHWILDDKLNVRMQIQLHKIIWPEKDRGV